MFQLIADVVLRRGWVFLLGWIAVAAGLFWIAPPWESVSKEDNVRFFPPGYPSVIGQELQERAFPLTAAGSLVVVIAERPDGPLTTADFAALDQMIAALDALRKEKDFGILKIDTHRTPVIGPRLVGTSRDGGKGQAVSTLIALKGTYLAKTSRRAVDKIETVLKAPPESPGLRWVLTGSAVVGHDMNTAAGRSLHTTTTATIALVVIILLVVYRSPLLALIPLLTIALSVWVALKAIAALTRVPNLNFQVIDITNIFVVVVLFGAGTDYCLFLIARYREELIRGRNRRAALQEAITQVGGALVASAGTVIVGLGMLWFSTFSKIQYTGPAIALSLAIGLLAALTLAPILLHCFRGSVFWPFQQPHHRRGADREQETLEQLPLSGFWVQTANLVVRRPLVILTICVLPLAPLAIVGARTTPNYNQLADLNPNQPSSIGSQTIKRYFPLGEQSPSSVLIAHPRINFRSDEGRKIVEEISKRIAGISNVAEVRSISRPLGKPLVPVSERNWLARNRDSAFRLLADPRFVSVSPADKADRDHITRLDVVFKTDPFSDPSLRTLEYVHATIDAATNHGQPLAGASDVGLTGASAAINDLRKVTTQDQQRMYWLVTIGVYLILVMLIRRPILCLYLIATVVLGYLASLGVTELVFKALHHGPDPWMGLDWKVGFFLFVILVAIGEDYNIFLMARVLEEEAKHGVIEGTRLAVAHTGGIISSCGLIMAGTFGSMLTGSLTALQELGFALGLGVLLDTFLVRPILVPAFIVLVERFRVATAAETMTAPQPQPTTTAAP